MTAARSPLTTSDLATLAQLARQLRVDSIRASTSAGSGHPTSSMSAADVLAVLVARHLRYDWDQPGDDGNDHLIFSKGHASPLLYSVYKAVGVVSDEELMTGYRRFGSRLQGHPTPVLPWVDVATGSLGQGLPDGVGVALAGKYLDRLPFRVWVLCGDSELAEGSIWEALDKAAHYELSNLVAIVDVNRLGQRGPTELGWDLDAYARRAEAFGARVLESRRSRPAAMDEALTDAARAATTGRPWCSPAPSKVAGSPKSRTTRAGTASRFPRTWRREQSPSLAARATCWCADLCPSSSRRDRRQRRRRDRHGHRAPSYGEARRSPPARPTATP